MEQKLTPNKQAEKLKPTKQTAEFQNKTTAAQTSF
jgi:hypothetical protein